jgi:hypothetical protein
MILGVALGEFMGWKGSEAEAEINGVRQPLKRHFKDARQLAKPINFGVPGGLSPRTLVGHARDKYGVPMTLEQAEAFHRKLTREIYPELAAYLEDNSMALLARSLGVPETICWDAFSRDGSRSPATPRSIRKIVAGNAFKADGTPYDEGYRRRVWETLNSLCRNEELMPLLEECRGTPKLAGRLFHASVVTPTGRVWGGVAYTQERNGPFQGVAADGAKLAIGRLALRGRRIVGFIHDEILEEIPDQGGYVDLGRVEGSVADVRKGMEEVTGGIPVSCEYTLSTCWSKRAELIVRDGKVYPWSPQA